jgi:hypothetical protein
MDLYPGSDGFLKICYLVFHKKYMYCDALSRPISLFSKKREPKKRKPKGADFGH